VTKSGKMTYGLDRFFSSLYGKTVPGLCFLSLSLLSVKRRTSYLNVALTKPKSPCEPHKISLTRHQAAARACRSSSL
jgi:hypothetical protein